MKVTYTLAANVNGNVQKDTLKKCDKGASATGSLLRQIAWMKGGLLTWLIIAIPSIAYYRKITKTDITYNFFLLP